MLNNGTANISKENLTSIFSSKLISNYISATPYSINISTNADKKDMKLAVNILKEQFLHPALEEESLMLAKKILKESLANSRPTPKKMIYSHTFPNSPVYSSDKEILNNLDNITIEDIKALYKTIMTNGCGSIAFSTSKDEPEYTEEILSIISTLPKTERRTYKLENNFTPEKNPVVLTHPNNNAQANIRIGYKYKTNLNLKYC